MNPTFPGDRARIPTLMAFATALFLTPACTGDGQPPRVSDAISQEAFVQAYYQLRSEGLSSSQMEISIGARDRILNDLGLTDEDLLNFVEVWGRDGEVMQGIWQAVDSLMREDRRERAEDPGIEGYEEREEPPTRPGRGGG